MNYFLFEHAKIKSFTLLAEVGGLVSLPMRKEKSPGARGNPRPEVPHYMRPGYLIMLCFQAFYLSFLQHFARSFSKKFHLIHKNSMSTFTGLVRLFSRRTARVLSSKNVANTFQSSCRARSIFAATTRGASQNLRYAIPCACTKVCACEVHKYTQGWFYSNFCGLCSYFPRNHGALLRSLNSWRMLSRLTWEKMEAEGGWIDSEGFILLVRIQRRRQYSSWNAAKVSGNLRKLWMPQNIFFILIRPILWEIRTHELAENHDLFPVASCGLVIQCLIGNLSCSMMVLHCLIKYCIDCIKWKVTICFVEK